MPTKYIPIVESDPEGQEHLESMLRSTFLDEACYEFALALEEGLGWNIVGLRAMHRGKETIRHVVLVTPEGTFFDARGFVALEQLGMPFDLLPPHKLQSGVARTHLEGIRPIHDRLIVLARRLAESTWPHLPWKNSLALRAQAFAEELEALSRKHGLWLYAPYATTWPRISDSDCDGDEVGYTLRPTSDGMKLTINRRLRHEG